MAVVVKKVDFELLNERTSAIFIAIKFIVRGRKQLLKKGRSLSALLR